MQIGCVGIDFGSTRSVIAVAKKGGVDVLANEGSHRETTNIVGYTDSERFVGEQAKSNFKNTVRYFNRLLGISPSYPLLREETKWISSKVSESGNGRLVHNVSYQGIISLILNTFTGQNTEFLPEQITATMLGKIRSIIENNNIANKEAVVSCPSYYTEPERKALLDACRIADLKCVRLFNECAAITLSYGLFRKTELDPQTPRHVVFVDFGHSKTSIFLASFTQSKGKILAQKNDRNLGVRDIDWILLKKYDEIFQQTSGGLSIFESKKAQIRMFDAIEKQRKMLSANMEAPINVEYLMEDCDLNYVMSRDELESLSAPVIQRFSENLKLIVEEIENRKINIHSIEVVGGGPRIPIIQRAILEAFGKECNRTLNASECIARGCAMEAAYKSPLFNVASYEIEEAFYYQVRMEWHFTKQSSDQMEEEPKKSLLFKKGDTVPTVKSLTFQRADGVDMNLYYDPAPEGIPPQITQIKIKSTKPKEKDFQVKVRIKMSDNGLISLCDANLIEDYTVEEKIKKEKPKQPEKPAEKPVEKPEDDKDMKAEDKPKDEPKEVPQEDEYEIKTKKKTRHTVIANESSQFHQLDKKQIDDFTLSEATMSNHGIFNSQQQSLIDKSIQDTMTRKNELESYIYTYRDKINNQYKYYTLPDQIPKINKLLQQTEDWLYGEGENANKSKYIDKKKALEVFCEPIKTRYIEYDNIPHSLQELEMVLKRLEDWTNTQVRLYFICNNQKDEKYAHIIPENRQKVWDECQKTRQWVADCQQKMQALQRFQDPVFTVDQIYKNIKNVQDATLPIVNQPKPEPKKEEKKPEENPAEGEGQKQEKQEEQQQKKDDKMDVEVD